jgi:DnaJ-class molecular chaperone
VSRRNVWTDPSPYGQYEGEPGDTDQWRDAFRQKFTPAEIREHLGSRTAWDVLGIPVGSPLAAIKQAYRDRARATHPDLNPGLDRAEFQAVQAAYQSLTERNGR